MNLTVLITDISCLLGNIMGKLKAIAFHLKQPNNALEIMGSQIEFPITELCLESGWNVTYFIM